MPEELRARVHKDTPINWGVRDLRDYVGEEEREMMDEELMPHQKYEMGVVPNHVKRSIQSGIGLGAVNAAVDSGVSIYQGIKGGQSVGQVGANIGRSIAGGASKGLENIGRFLSAPYDWPSAVRKGVEARDRATEQGDARMAMQAGTDMGKSIFYGVTAPIYDIVGQYRNPGQRTAKKVTGRLAKAKRKKDRREKDMSLVEGYWTRPGEDRKRVRQAVRKGEEDDKFEIAFSPGA